VECEALWVNPPGIAIRTGPGVTYGKRGTVKLDASGQVLVGKSKWTKMDAEGREWRPVCIGPWPDLWRGTHPDTSSWIAGWLLTAAPLKAPDLSEAKRKEIFRAIAVEQDRAFCAGQEPDYARKAVQRVAERYGITIERALDIVLEGDSNQWPTTPSRCQAVISPG
jgi:hypothetical protein